MKSYENHVPVMLNEVLKFMNPMDNEVYVDCTFGAGGYTEGILEKANCNVIGLDRDPSVKQFADIIKKKFNDRFDFYNIKFSDIESILNGNKVDGIVLDIGVSSMQIDNPERGFSFQKNSRLDMRMGNNQISAYEIVNNTPEKELADIVRFFYPVRKTKIDPATKTFQAIRIAVNGELDELKKILELSKTILKPNGRLVVVSFHSLEDKIVKDFIKKETSKGLKKDKYSKEENKADFELLTNKAITPTEEEIKNNVRARSAKLRAIKKCKK